MNRVTLRWAVVFVALAGAACGSRPVIVGYEPPPDPPAPEPPRRVFTTSMGDPFAVDQPVLQWEDGAQRVVRAFDGRQHLVAWTSAQGLRAVRYDLAGELLDREPVLIAPREMVTGGIFAMALPAGGFDVLWAGPYFYDGSSLAFPGFGTLYASRLGADGAATLPRPSEAMGDSFELVAAGELDPSNGRYALLRLVTAQTDAVRLDSRARLIGEHGNWGPIANPGIGGRVVSVPKRVGKVALVHLGDRDYLATLAGEPTVQLELRAIGRTAAEPDAVIFSTPLTLPAVDARYRKPFALESVGDRVALVWRDWTADPSTVLRGVSVQPGSGDTFDVSGVVELARSTERGSRDVTATAAGDALLVGVRGIVGRAYDATDPLAIAVDPATLAKRWTMPGDQVPNAEISLRDCSWDGVGCLAIVSADDTSGIVFTQRVLPGGGLSAVTPAQGLPGRSNEQRNPAAACSSKSCMLAWQDDRGALGVSDAFAIRVSKETGLPIDIDAHRLFDSNAYASPAVAANRLGFVAAQAGCNGGVSGQTMQLSVRVVPEEGPWGELQRLDLPGRPCGAWTQVAVAAHGERALVLALERDKHDYPQLVIAEVAADGVARLRPFNLAAGQWAYGAVDAVVTEDRAVLALQAGGYWTTAVLDLTGAGADVAGLEMKCLVEPWCNEGPRRLVQLPGQTTVGWVELDRPGRFTTGEVDWALTWTELDDRGLLTGPARTLVGDRGEARGLAVSADETGLVVMLAERTYASEDFRVLFRRFGDVTRPGPAPAVRTVVDGVYTPGHAVAAAGDGQWLTAYATAGAVRGNVWVIGGPASRVLGRFVYEAPDARVGTGD